MPTKSADKKYDTLEKRGAELLSKPEDKPWGWRSFYAVDPNGVVLDFFHVYKDFEETDAGKQAAASAS